MSSHQPIERETILSPWDYAFPTAGELAVLRDRAGVTQADVANRLDVNRKTVMAWESGSSSPSLEITRELLGIYRAEILSRKR